MLQGLRGVAGSPGFAGVSRSATPGGAGDPATPADMTANAASGTPGNERITDIPNKIAGGAFSTTPKTPGGAGFHSGVYPAHAGHADAVALAPRKMQRALVLARGRGRLHKQLIAHAKRMHAEVLVGAREGCRQSRGRGRRQSRGRGRRQSRGRGCVAVAIGSTHQRPSARAPPGTAGTFGGWRPPKDPERKKQFEAIRDAYQAMSTEARRAFRAMRLRSKLRKITSTPAQNMYVTYMREQFATISQENPGMRLHEMVSKAISTYQEDPDAADLREQASLKKAKTAKKPKK